MVARSVTIYPVHHFRVVQQVFRIGDRAMLVFRRQPYIPHDRCAGRFVIVFGTVTQKIAARKVKSLAETGEFLDRVRYAVQPEGHVPLVGQNSGDSAGANGSGVGEFELGNGQRPPREWIDDFTSLLALPG